MGTWGTGIFSNDEACDVRSEYTAIIGSGIDDAAALKMLKSYFNIQDLPCEEEADFWYAMASLQYRYGRLCKEVKENALECIGKGLTISDWSTSKSVSKRQQTLNDLREKLLSENQNPIKSPKCKLKKALGSTGDVLAYHLINYSPEFEFQKQEKILALHHIEYDREELKTNCAAPWFFGKYVLLYIVAVKKEPISKVIPDLGFNEYTICCLYKWIGNEIPDVLVTNNLEICPWSKLKQKTGGYLEDFFMNFSPCNNFQLKTKQYVSNIGKGFYNGSVRNSGLLVTELEEELKHLFSNNKDIENEFKKILYKDG